MQPGGARPDVNKLIGVFSMADDFMNGFLAGQGDNKKMIPSASRT